MLVGYALWTRLSKSQRLPLRAAWHRLRHVPVPGPHRHDADRMELVVVYAGLAGIFQAGLDLVFFDELMKTVPPELQRDLRLPGPEPAEHGHGGLAAPRRLAGRQIGLCGALLVSAGLRMVGFVLFLKIAEDAIGLTRRLRGGRRQVSQENGRWTS